MESAPQDDRLAAARVGTAQRERPRAMRPARHPREVFRGYSSHAPRTVRRVTWYLIRKRDDDSRLRSQRDFNLCALCLCALCALCGFPYVSQDLRNAVLTGVPPTQPPRWLESNESTWPSMLPQPLSVCLVYSDHFASML